MLLRLHASLLAAALCLASCDSPTGPGNGGAPARLDVVSGGGQRDTVGQELPQPLVVRLVDARGRPVRDHVVSFRVTAGGGAVSAGTAVTNADGEARERWTLGTTAREPQHVEARAVDPATNQALVFGVFTAVGLADVPANISPTGPAAFAISPGGVMPVGVRVLDRFGNRVPGATIAWQAADGTVTPAEGATDSTGVAAAQWTLAYAVGAQTVTAFAGVSLSTQFTASTPAPSGSQLVVVSGDRQRGVAGAALAEPLVVRLQNAEGQPLRGAAVAWSVSAGTITPAAAVTDAQGQASATWNTGTGPGRRTASVSAAGVNSILFTAEATVGEPVELRKDAGDVQSGVAERQLPVPVRVAVLDAYGNPVPGQVVRWRVVSGGGSASPASGVTTDGYASTRWTLGPVVGQQVIEAELGTLRARFAVEAAAPVVRFVSPEPWSRVGDSFRLVVTATHGEAVTGVTAAVADRSFPLAFSGGQWAGNVSLLGLPGTQTVQVTARSAAGVIDSTSATYLHDNAPVVQVELPVSSQVASPSIRVKATCSDDDAAGCSSFVVRLPSREVPLAQGTASIDTTVSLAGHEGSRVTLEFMGRDAAGQMTIVTRQVDVQASAARSEVARRP